MRIFAYLLKENRDCYSETNIVKIAAQYEEIIKPGLGKCDALVTPFYY